MHCLYAKKNTTTTLKTIFQSAFGPIFLSFPSSTVIFSICMLFFLPEKFENDRKNSRQIDYLQNAELMGSYNLTASTYNVVNRKSGFSNLTVCSDEK